MIDPTKTYRTRNGSEVRIYAVDGVGDFAIHGAMLTNDGWWATCWRRDGTMISSGPDASKLSDLIEVKPRHKRTVWLNVYQNEGGAAGHDTKEEADAWQSSNRIACIKVELDFEEGEGL